MTIFRTMWTAAACVILTAGAAQAGSASDWSKDSQSAMRLIAGNNTDGTPLRAGIEIRLQPRWHTYWRYPGDSGVPPRFDFAGSDNLKAATVRFPAPLLFSDDSGSSIGYKDKVVFPVTVVPADPVRPVIVRLTIDYAVCEKLCIPAQGKAELSLSAEPSTEDAALAAAEAQVPQRVTAADLGLSLRRINDADKPLIAVDLVAKDLAAKDVAAKDVVDKGDAPVTMFVEGPTAGWALPIPKPMVEAPAGHRRFSFELDGLPPDVSPKGPHDLTVTVVQGGRAYEAAARLD